MLTSLALLGCDSATEPEVFFGRSIQGITVTLDASALVTKPGDVVRLGIAAHNFSGHRVQIGFLAGPALDAVIVRPNGARTSALLEMSGGAGPNRDLGEPHYVDAGETQRVELVWHAPTVRGLYMVIGGLRGADRGLYNPSEPVHIAVR